MNTTGQTSQPSESSRPSLRLAAGQISRRLGSLQMALILLPMFATALFLGTLVESWYDGKVARHFVYGTWWFAALLGLLGVTIFFAAIKKWPWKKHQTGFLITHVGLLCLVAGGLVNSLSGVNAMMVMVDSNSVAAQSFGRQQSNLLIDRSVHSIQLQRLGETPSELASFDFRPGVLAWRTDDRFTGSDDPVASLMNRIAHPFPRDGSYQLDDQVRLEIVNFYPHARRQAFGHATGRVHDSFPAIKFQLSSPAFGDLPKRWAALDGSNQDIRVGSARIELLKGNCSPEQVANFLNHPPDYFETDVAVKGVLQFVTNQNGKLFYRTFAGVHSGGLAFEQSGEAKSDETLAIWKRKSWTLRITQFIPHARRGPVFEPVPRRVGLEDDQTPPAIRCRLVTNKGEKEIWLGKGDGQFETVSFAGQRFLVGYNSKLRDLDFELSLLRAEQRLDRGSTQPASQSSYVLLDDPIRNVYREARVITLNQPLSHRGYKVYQSDYRLLGIDENSRPISRVVLIVSRDPGVRLKYAGSVMLALGITCMFYMRAYFFKPRTSPRNTGDETAVNSEDANE